jgi:hypothetical protein
MDENSLKPNEPTPIWIVADRKFFDEHPDVASIRRYAYEGELEDLLAKLPAHVRPHYDGLFQYQEVNPEFLTGMVVARTLGDRLRLPILIDDPEKAAFMPVKSGSIALLEPGWFEDTLGSMGQPVLPRMGRRDVWVSSEV